MQTKNIYRILPLLLVCACSKTPERDEVSTADAPQAAEPSPSAQTGLEPGFLPLTGKLTMAGQDFPVNEIGGYVGLLGYSGSTAPQQATHLSVALNTTVGSLTVRGEIPPGTKQLTGLVLPVAGGPTGTMVGFVQPTGSFVSVTGTLEVVSADAVKISLAVEDLVLKNIAGSETMSLRAAAVGPLKVDCYVPLAQVGNDTANGMSNDSGEPAWAPDKTLSSEFCAGLRSMAKAP